jgi:hypothetical protein
MRLILPILLLSMAGCSHPRPEGSHVDCTMTLNHWIEESTPHWTMQFSSSSCKPYGDLVRKVSAAMPAMDFSPAWPDGMYVEAELAQPEGVKVAYPPESPWISSQAMIVECFDDPCVCRMSDGSLADNGDPCLTHGLHPMPKSQIVEAPSRPGQILGPDGKWKDAKKPKVIEDRIPTLDQTPGIATCENTACISSVDVSQLQITNTFKGPYELFAIMDGTRTVISAHAPEGAYTWSDVLTNKITWTLQIDGKSYSLSGEKLKELVKGGEK